LKAIDICPVEKLGNLPPEIIDILENSPSAFFPNNRNEILFLAMHENNNGVVDVTYDIPGRGSVTECTITRCKNGLAVNFTEPKPA